MMKKWQCTICLREVLAFADDIENNNTSTFEEVFCGKRQIADHICQFSPSFHQPPPTTIHGEAGFLCEGTVFDSIDSIHDVEHENIIKAENERELKMIMGKHGK